MDIGLLTDGVGHLTREAALDFAAGLGLRKVELAAGNWSAAPHLDLDAVLGDGGELRRLRGELESRGLVLSALLAARGSRGPALPVGGRGLSVLARPGGLR